MQVAKATPEDITAVFKVISILELLTSNSLPEEWLDDEFTDDWFSEQSDTQCGMALRKLLEIADIGALFRVAMGMSVLTDPVNKMIDPNLDVLDHHPEIKASATRIAELTDALKKAQEIFIESGISEQMPKAMVRIDLALRGQP